MDSRQVLRSLVVVLVVVSCPHVSCMPAKISESQSDTMILAEIVRCQLWSMHSGRFVGVNPDKTLHAMGQSDGQYICTVKQFMCGRIYNKQGHLCM